MIIIGFPGVGKSTLSRGVNPKYLDLESSMFTVNKKKIDNWEIPYVRTAEYLSRKGFDVFVSSHAEVSAQLEHSTEIVVMVFPDESLKAEWINRLRKRYSDSQLPKDKNAIRRMAMHYTEDVNSMAAIAEEYQFPTIVLKSMDYDLKKELEEVMSI